MVQEYKFSIIFIIFFGHFTATAYRHENKHSPRQVSMASLNCTFWDYDRYSVVFDRFPTFVTTFCGQ